MTSGGFFVVFEGGDGVGKSTQIDLLARYLTEAGHTVTTTREPGGTDLGVELRQAVMHGDFVAPRAEALLYAADRAHHVHAVVRPALSAGHVVLQDRYIDSSVVYQGGARGLGDMVEQISLWATEGLLPHLTVVLDLAAPPERLSRDLDRVERDTASQREAIRSAFVERAGLDPDRYAVIDASGTVEDVHQAVLAAVTSAMNAAQFPPGDSA